MKKGRNIVLLLLFACCFFTLGYFRNYIFLTVNDRAAALMYNAQSPPMNGILSIFKSYTYTELITAKWILTFLFTVFFTALSALTVYIVFRNQHYTTVSLVFNGAIFICSLLFIACANLVQVFAHNGFIVSRSLEHFVQSPVPTIVIVLAIYYQKTVN